MYGPEAAVAVAAVDMARWKTDMEAAQEAAASRTGATSALPSCHSAAQQLVRSVPAGHLVRAVCPTPPGRQELPGEIAHSAHTSQLMRAAVAWAGQMPPVVAAAQGVVARERAQLRQVRRGPLEEPRLWPGRVLASAPRPIRELVEELSLRVEGIHFTAAGAEVAAATAAVPWGMAARRRMAQRAAVAADMRTAQALK